MAPEKRNSGRRGGRKKGSLNKMTYGVKAALTKAFEERGGVNALLKWSNDEPTEFYKLWGKLLPQEINQKLAGRLSADNPLERIVLVLNDSGRDPPVAGPDHG